MTNQSSPSSETIRRQQIGDRIWDLFSQTGTLLRTQGVINVVEVSGINNDIHGYYGTLGDKTAHLHAFTLESNDERVYVIARLLRRANIPGARLTVPTGLEYRSPDVVRGTPTSESLPYSAEDLAELVNDVFRD